MLVFAVAEASTSEKRYHASPLSQAAPDIYAIIEVGGVQMFVEPGKWYTCNRLKVSTPPRAGDAGVAHHAAARRGARHSLPQHAPSRNAAATHRTRHPRRPMWARASNLGACWR